jgi:NAD(P)-dependent dehydrogenase (short-subunit alcohol dehydrogenase family)
MSRRVRRFDGQVAVVTGAASGIGNQLARDLVDRGAQVFGVDVHADSLQEVLGIRALHCDLADVDAYKDLLSGIERECGRVDLLANVAGVDEPVSAIDADTAFYRRVLEVNFFAAVVGTLSVLPGMTRRGFGSILNCSSDSVRTPIAYESAYIASKGALSAFTESVALEVRSFGVSVHILYPGFVETPLAVRSLERGMKRPPRTVIRTTEQVSAAALNGLGRRAIEINVARAAALAPLLRILVPPLYRQVMAGRAMPR